MDELIITRVDEGIAHLVGGHWRLQFDNKYVVYTMDLFTAHSLMLVYPEEVAIDRMITIEEEVALLTKLKGITNV